MTANHNGRLRTPASSSSLRPASSFDDIELEELELKSRGGHSGKTSGEVTGSGPTNEVQDEAKDEANESKGGFRDYMVCVQLAISCATQLMMILFAENFPILRSAG